MPRREKVTKVYDGDTFLTNRRKRPVRLDDVDTPEKRKPDYQKAKQELSELILDNYINVDTVARDKFGRPIAKVKVGTRYVNKVMGKYKKR